MNFLEFDAQDRAIVNRLQNGLPLVLHPYAAVAEELGVSEEELLARLTRLRDSGVLSRFGPMYHAERMGGGLTLAALAVPEADYERVVEILNNVPEVAHNYRREHTLNMWFVLATESSERIPQVVTDIEVATGLPVFNMPKEREFYVRVHLSV
ncbi:AsnC family transcriptional regulator [Halomonas alkaliantarctica]|uniref:siroheme decarboxylase n=1 Tax=Halomonas alkaliantarctica TaxID=232346 RepID=A0ABY8LTE5_9GAMM|nr:AsnC family transcriptional regulator [Halomonas alkaliantarctica]WGI27156.1 AsnC family transcriptional regulator [Halomonas alkaliantarctica]